jgi:hypothetical protein
MRVGVGLAGEEAGEEIAVGEGGFLAEADDDEIKGGDHVEALLFGADGGDEIARAAGVELVAIDGELENLDRLELGIRWRAIEPKAEAVGGIGATSDEELGEVRAGDDFPGGTVADPIDEGAELGPLRGGEGDAAMNERIAGIVTGPFRDVDVEGIEDAVLEKILHAFAFCVKFAAENFTERLIVDGTVMELAAGRGNEMDVDRGGELIAVGINEAAVGIEAAGLGKELADGDDAAAIAAPFGEGIAGFLVEGEEAFLHGDQGADGDEAFGAAINPVGSGVVETGEVALIDQSPALFDTEGEAAVGTGIAGGGREMVGGDLRGGNGAEREAGRDGREAEKGEKAEKNRHVLGSGLLEQVNPEPPPPHDQKQAAEWGQRARPFLGRIESENVEAAREEDNADQPANDGAAMGRPALPNGEESKRVEPLVGEGRFPEIEMAFLLQKIVDGTVGRHGP